MPYSFDPPPNSECPICKGNGFFIDSKRQLAHATKCSCVPECKRCGGSGFIVLQNNGVQKAGRCRCQKITDRINIFNAAKIPAIHGANDFINFC